MTEIQGKSILVRVSEGSSYQESTVYPCRVVLQPYKIIQSWVNLLFSVLQDSFLHSILDSLFSILDPLFVQESRRESRLAMDCQLAFERYCTCVTLCYPVLPCYPLLPCVTLRYPLLPCVTLCYSLFPCVTLCYPVLPCVTLCYPVLPSVTLCFPLLFVTLCYPLLGSVALSLPRRRFKGSSFFIPPHKRLFSRKQHSFPIVLFSW